MRVVTQWLVRHGHLPPALSAPLLIPEPIGLRTLTRREIRYRLYRMAAGDPVRDAADLYAWYEQQSAFDGWPQFARTWDVHPVTCGQVVPRLKSRAADWQETVEQVAPDWGA